MATILDPNQFEEVNPSSPQPAPVGTTSASSPTVPSTPQVSQQPVNQPAPAPTAPPAPTASAAPSPMGTPAPAAPKTLNPNDVEELPATSNGLSPLTPVNRSPLTAVERMKLANGNEKGNMEYLKGRFQDVTKDADGNMLVKDQGLWHRMNGKTFEDADSWSATAGIVKTLGAYGLQTLGMTKSAQELADSNPVSHEVWGKYGAAMPTLLKVGTAALAGEFTLGLGAGLTGVGAAGEAAAGAGGEIAAHASKIMKIANLGLGATGAGLAGAAGEGVRTSLGRLEGTYQSTPEEQLKDVAWEGLLNAAGHTIAAGVKPTASFIADKIPQLGQAYKAMSEMGRNAIISLLGAPSGVGSDAVQTIMEKAPAVKMAMKSIDAVAGNSTANYSDEVTRRSISEVKNVAEAVPRMMSEVYRGQQAQLINSVRSDFQSNVGDATKDVMQKMINSDMVTLKQGRTLLSPVEAAQKFASGDMEGMDLVMRPREQIAATLASKGQIGSQAAYDDEAHGLMSKFFDQVKTLNQTKTLSGKAGASQLLSANKVLDDMTYTLGQKAQSAGLADVQRTMAEFHGNIRNSVEQSFDKAGSPGLFKTLQASYTDMKSQLADVLSAKRLADNSGSDKAYESLVNRIGSRGGANVPVKDSFNATLALADKYGSKEAAGIRASQESLRVLDAAKKFNPLLRPGLVGQGSIAAGIGGAAAAATGATSGAALLPVAAVAAGTSPRAAMGAALLTKNIWAMNDFMAGLGAKGTRQLFSNPAYSNALVNGVISATNLVGQTEGALMQHAQQTIMGGQQQPQGGGQ